MLQNPFRKLSPVAASSWSFGVSSRRQPGSSGQWHGYRCWSVISSRMFGGCGAQASRSIFTSAWSTDARFPGVSEGSICSKIWSAARIASSVSK